VLVSISHRSWLKTRFAVSLRISLKRYAMNESLQHTSYPYMMSKRCLQGRGYDASTLRLVGRPQATATSGYLCDVFAAEFSAKVQATSVMYVLHLSGSSHAEWPISQARCFICWIQLVSPVSHMHSSHSIISWYSVTKRTNSRRALSLTHMFVCLQGLPVIRPR
jgi:hypothetical protein